ncbi:uncharacterized protein LOC141673576 [Apium graveolens]|uniref:uncharacterized protein LOC141673576 n=1 Tax=Apium graveolens TaxID=4045 RepID=UPI003D7B89F0
MRAQGQDVTFNVFNAMKFPTDEEELFKVELVDSVVTSELDQMLWIDALERALIGDFDSEDEEGAEQLQYLNSSPWKRRLDFPFKSLGLLELKNSQERLKPSIEEAHTLKLKPLPDHLRQGADQIIRRCIPYSKTEGILRDCHSIVYGGHYGGEKTASRILQAGFFCPTLFKDAHQFVLRCDRCQRVENMSKRDEVPLNVFLEVEIFDVWGIDFMGPFISSCDNQYILLAVDYVSK